MGNIFISYRREDTSDWARSVHDKLEARFGAKSLFMDIDNRVLAIDSLLLRFCTWLALTRVLKVGNPANKYVPRVRGAKLYLGGL